jgi:hypothetical protein
VLHPRAKSRLDSGQKASWRGKLNPAAAQHTGQGQKAKDVTVSGLQ